MSGEKKPDIDEIKRFYKKLDEEARSGGYLLNPDEEFTMELAEGLVVNLERYGYESCPCRLASGIKEEDLDIICPCYWRDPDLGEYGTCYCGLYVSADVAEGRKKTGSIPERRPPLEERQKKQGKTPDGPGRLRLPVYRCNVCGYLCARENPPEVCPVCKAKKERFERFI